MRHQHRCGYMPDMRMTVPVRLYGCCIDTWSICLLLQVSRCLLHNVGCSAWLPIELQVCIIQDVGMAPAYTVDTSTQKESCRLGSVSSGHLKKLARGCTEAGTTCAKAARQDHLDKREHATSSAKALRGWETASATACGSGNIPL
jgi:hypothetical protein